jgi:hypothetical protein
MPADNAPDLSRFDSDPEALAWARGHVEALESRYRKFAEHVAAKGDKHNAERFTKFADRLRTELIGGRGCVITPFDERRHLIPPAGRPFRDQPQEPPR